MMATPVDRPPHMAPRRYTPQRNLTKPDKPKNCSMNYP